MRIAVDGRAIPFTGMGNYTQSLLHWLPQVSSEEYLVYNDGLRVSRRSFKEKYFNTVRRIQQEQWKLPAWLKNNQADVFFSPRNKGIPFAAGCPCVVTIHDVLPYAFPKIYFSSQLEKMYYSLMTGLAVHRSNRIITDSEFSRRELLKYTDIKGEQCAVIYLGCGEQFNTCLDRELSSTMIKRLGLSKPFLVTIGGSEYRKNVRSLLEIFTAKLSSQYELVVVGGAWRGIDLAQEYSRYSEIHFVQNISDAELRCLYQLAELFVFPSYYEGFGMPVLEAMACGAAVAASAATSVPEVGGSSAVYFNPYDRADMYRVIRKMLDSKMLRQEAALSALERVKAFSWGKTAAAVHRVLCEAARE